MKAINNIPFYLSNINDHFEGEIIYFVKVDYEGEYSFLANVLVNLYDANDKLIASHINENKTIYLKKGNYYIQALNVFGINLEIKVNRVDNKPFAPYPIIDNTNDTNTLKVSKRKGYTYIYNNVPENMQPNILNTIIMENKDLEGECFLTFENQNHTGKDIYMGYRITNIEDHPIYVTVLNVGYQYNGSWLGEKSWMDYYGIKYEIANDFNDRTINYYGKEFNAGSWFNDYLNFNRNYIPNPIKPTTYVLMPNTHMYVIGGTSADSYNNINVNNTANILIKGDCINGNVRFSITNGKATGHLCVYNDIEYINSNKAPISQFKKNFEGDDLGGRMGITKNLGVIDTQATFRFDDSKHGNLKMSFINRYGDDIAQTIPGKLVPNIKEYKHTLDRWYSHLSSQLHHDYIGEDMVENTTIFEDKEIILSVYRGNPAGKIWDFGNWMIEYHDNMAFINEGNKTRKLSFYKSNPGSIFYIIKDNKENILKAGVTLTTCTGNTPIYEVDVKANEKLNLIIEYVLPANNNGSIEHIIKLD